MMAKGATMNDSENRSMPDLMADAPLVDWKYSGM
jgi:hypothetical protein